MANLPPTPLGLLTSGPLKPRPLAKPKPIGARRTSPAPPKQTPANPNSWSPAADPVVAQGPSGSGTVRTRSGRFVDTTMAAYVTGPTDKAYGANPPPQIRPPHDPAAGAHPAAAATPPKPPGNRVAAMQQFLRSKGYDIAVDGIQGPLTSAAAADWRSTRNPTGWNDAHNGHGAAAAAAVDTAPAPAPAPTPKKTPPRAPADATPAAAPAAPAVTPEEQARQTVMSILKPLIDQINTAAGARSKAGQAAITGYTNDAVDKLKGLDFEAPYTGAAAGANAVNDATLALLKGQGSQLADQVGAKLSAAGQNTGTVTANLNADTAGASGAGYAHGGATVDSLLAQGADAAAYGKKLPGIETLAGLQASKGLEGQISADTAKQLGDITAQTPQLIQTTLSNLHTQANQDKALQINAILASGYDPATGTLTPKARAALAGIVGTDPGALKGGSATTVGKAGTATAAASKISPGVSAGLGYAATADGTPVTTKDGKIVPWKNGKQGTPKVPTANELSKFVDAWFDGKAATQRVQVQNPDGSPVTDANGAPVYRTVDAPKVGQLDYGQAYKRLVALNVTDQQARQLLDTRYARGARGRAWLTNEEQAALKNARLSPKATRYKSVAFLTRDQVAALQQAHKLPPGEWAGNHYVIDQTY